MTLAERLAEAESALHRLIIGRGVVEVTDANNERVSYSRTSLAALRAYIADLRRQIAGAVQPTSFTFKTSKGLF